MIQAGTLLAEQAALQAQADALVSRLDLVETLSRIGRPVRVGSSAMGLMVRRDIDITVICPRLDRQTLDAFAAIGAGLMMRDEIIGAVRFRNDSGGWNADPAAYPDGFYLGLTARDTAGLDWTFDIWAVDDPARQPDLRHLETLQPRLTDASRTTIVAIKQALIARSDGRPAVPSISVYEAVLDHAVTDIAQFDAWLQRSGKS